MRKLKSRCSYCSYEITVEYEDGQMEVAVKIWLMKTYTHVEGHVRKIIQNIKP